MPADQWRKARAKDIANKVRAEDHLHGFQQRKEDHERRLAEWKARRGPLPKKRPRSRQKGRPYEPPKPRPEPKITKFRMPWGLFEGKPLGAIRKSYLVAIMENVATHPEITEKIKQFFSHIEQRQREGVQRISEKAKVVAAQSGESGK